MKTLDCGHEESPHSECTRGYGTTADGKRHCYECCLTADIRTMQTDGRITAYLSGDGTRITNWPGHTLAVVTREWHTSAGGFARGTRVWATAGDGSHWYGRGPGRGMYLRLIREKGRSA